jgi:trimethylamine:corrinoid methyltransferase-like protein
MALGIAENMVGLVIHQLTHQGAPFLFAPNVSVLDMRQTVVSYGCNEWSLTQATLADHPVAPKPETVLEGIEAVLDRTKALCN